jgi:outer membrane lipoprotein-sorting protein
MGFTEVLLTIKDGTIKSVFSRDALDNSIYIEFTDVATEEPIPMSRYRIEYPEGTSINEQ